MNAVNDPLKALQEARSLEEKEEATREVAGSAATLRESIARALASRNDSFRIDVLNALGASRDPSLIDLVERLIDSNPDPPVLRVAAIALGNLGGPRAFDSLTVLLRHRDPAARIGAIRGLAILRDPRALEPLRALLDDQSSARATWPGAKAGGYIVGKEAAIAVREITGEGR